MSQDQQKSRTDLLNDREKEALRRLGEGPSNRLSPAAAVQFYGLFLQGYSCEEIARQNPKFGSLALGLIVRARVEYDWDAERETHTRTLMVAAKQALEKATLEGVQFASDGMAVFHKMVGDKFKRYLQTGDVKELGEYKDLSFKTYKDMVELLQTLSGQDKDKNPTVMVNVPGPVQAQPTSVVNPMPVVPEERPPTPEEAAAILMMSTQVKA